MRQLTKTAIFVAAPLKKHLAVHFTILQFMFFVNLLTETFYGFSAKVLPTCWIYKPGFYFFSLHKIKMSKQG